MIKFFSRRYLDPTDFPKGAPEQLLYLENFGSISQNCQVLLDPKVQVKQVSLRCHISKMNHVNAVNNSISLNF
jgi:hypothetical protein